VRLFIMLYRVVLTFESVDEILSVTIQMKATEQNFPGAPVYYAVQGGSNF